MCTSSYLLFFKKKEQISLFLCRLDFHTCQPKVLGCLIKMYLWMRFQGSSCLSSDGRQCFACDSRHSHISGPSGWSDQWLSIFPVCPARLEARSVCGCNIGALQLVHLLPKQHINISDLFRLCPPPPPPSLVGAYYLHPPDARAIFLLNGLLCNGTCSVTGGRITYWGVGAQTEKIQYFNEFQRSQIL